MNDRLRAQPVTQVPPKPPLLPRLVNATILWCILALVVMLTIKFGLLLFG